MDGNCADSPINDDVFKTTEILSESTPSLETTADGEVRVKRELGCKVKLPVIKDRETEGFFEKMLCETDEGVSDLIKDEEGKGSTSSVLKTREVRKIVLKSLVALPKSKLAVTTANSFVLRELRSPH